MAFANPYMLGELGHQYLSGWANQTCVDTLEMEALALIADVQPCDKASCKTCTFVSAWRVAVQECKERVHRSFIKWLHAKGEEWAARWFENQWEGKSWMLCDICYSIAGGNKGQEGSHRFKHGATGGGRKNLNLQYCLSLLAQYMKDHSELLESRAIAHGIKHTSFQRTPELTCHHWDLATRNPFFFSANFSTFSASYMEISATLYQNLC
jgi:hypothetical protein